MFAHEFRQIVNGEIVNFMAASGMRFAPAHFISNNASPPATSHGNSSLNSVYLLTIASVFSSLSISA